MVNRVLGKMLEKRIGVKLFLFDLFEVFHEEGKENEFSFSLPKLIKQNILKLYFSLS